MMAPPGRRRESGVFALLALFLLLILPQAHAAVIGIDLGTENIKAALVKPGVPLDIVLTKDSRRKEAASIAFKPATHAGDKYEFPERLYGADASALSARFPADVYPNLKPLLGSLQDSREAFDAYRERYPAVGVLQDRETQSLAVKSSSVTDGTFSVEELLSMQLKNVKENAEIMAGKGALIEDAVITVPAFFTADERLAIEQAAELAGLKVLSLVSDGLAVGLHYAVSRTFPNIDQGAKPEYHMVYDMGAGSTTATVLRFQARTIKTGKYKKTNTTFQELSVMGTDWDRRLGGDALNWLIVDDMIKQFVESGPAKAAGVQEEAVRKHGRAMSKLWKDAQKVRSVLSANTNTGASFEGLYDDIDFRYKLTRADFEAMASGFASRVGSPLTGALAAAKLSVSDLDSIVLHGGAVRTPFVQKRLESLTDNPAQLRVNVNADEAAVLGAAFRAAGLSPSFRVKEINTADSGNYAASLTWASGDKERRQTIFTPTSVTDNVKQIPFNKLEDFEVSTEQIVGDNDVRMVAQFKITNVTASVNELIKSYGCQKEGIKTQLSARLDPYDALPEIVSGSVSCQSDQEKKKSVVDGVKGLFGFGGKKDAENDTEVPEEASASADASASDASATPSAKDKGKDKASATPKAPVMKTHTIPLAIETTLLAGKRLSKANVQALEERLVAFDASDAARRLREELYNRLEASTYRIRDILEEASFAEVSTSAQRDAISKLLSSTSDWLYSDGASAATEAVREKLNGLQDLVSPIRKRVDEATKRPAAVEGLQTALTSAKSVLQLVKDNIERAAEASSSYAAAVASESASATSEEEETETTAPDPLDGDAEADADELASASQSSKSAAKAAKASATPPPEPALYSQYDVESVEGLLKEAEAWLADKTGLQNKLKAHEEPVLLSTDVQRRADALQSELQRILAKTPMRRPKSSGSSSSKKASAKKSKGSSSSSSSGKAKASETPAAGGEGPETGEKVPEHKEL